MSKSKSGANSPAGMSTETGRGQVKHNHLAALVTSKVYRQQVVKAKKGKGSYKRNNKNGQEPYLMAA